ncbi:MAG TPA: hypothetical protein VLT58_03060 [Polyangia bacterium]|nr:hypothetical protein [Polyangia bacterium]
MFGAPALIQAAIIESCAAGNFPPGGMRATGGTTGSVNAFVDTNIATKPPKSGFDLNVQAAIDWTTPTLQ